MSEQKYAEVLIRLAVMGITNLEEVITTFAIDENSEWKQFSRSCYELVATNPRNIPRKKTFALLMFEIKKSP